MNLGEIISDLQKYCFIGTEDCQEKHIFKNCQLEFYDGFVGIICNRYNNSDKYEVYLNIKSTGSITCPLLYNKTS